MKRLKEHRNNPKREIEVFDQVIKDLQEDQRPRLNEVRPCVGFRQDMWDAAIEVIQTAKERVYILSSFSNPDHIDDTIQHLLQLDFEKTTSSASRFIINSTIGIGGILDPASSMGLERHDEDFGQTLGLWGVSPGPYLMIPFLGPTTTRDLLSRPISSFLEVTFHMDDSNVRISLSALDAIETRERLLDVESLLSGDKYNFVRDSYSQSREYEIKDGLNIVDEFTDDMDDFLIDQ